VPGLTDAGRTRFMERKEAPVIAQSPHAGQYERARALADAGRHEEAITAIREYLRHEPEDGEAFNDAGALLYAAGRFDEAADFLKRAAACMRDAPGQALWNLAEVYLAGGRPAEVLPLFDGLAQAQLMTADLANRTATRFLDSGDVAGAVEAIIYSVRLAPQQDALLPIYERVRALRPKVAICCEFPDVKFMQDIYAFINARFETRLVQGQIGRASCRERV
jgi:tetratricopeptide (TPR) repeat protein